MCLEVYSCADVCGARMLATSDQMVESLPHSPLPISYSTITLSLNQWTRKGYSSNVRHVSFGPLNLLATTTDAVAVLHLPLLKQVVRHSGMLSQL